MVATVQPKAVVRHPSGFLTAEWLVKLE